MKEMKKKFKIACQKVMKLRVKVEETKDTNQALLRHLNEQLTLMMLNQNFPAIQPQIGQLLVEEPQ